ncbi:MAG: hypothetical protein OQK11_07925 [Thiovulaceae bacterium]|nr:hypothetical protein [Sulfurimonadaceae bacterium]
MKYLLILSLIITSLFSAPAYNALRTFKQADGTEFKARAQGNHHLNWIEDENGEILKYNAKTKNYDYAVIKDTQLKASGYKYQTQNLKKSAPKEQREVQKIDKKELGQLMKQRRSLKSKGHTH